MRKALWFNLFRYGCLYVVVHSPSWAPSARLIFFGDKRAAATSALPALPGNIPALLALGCCCGPLKGIHLISPPSHLIVFVRTTVSGWHTHGHISHCKHHESCKQCLLNVSTAHDIHGMHVCLCCAQAARVNAHDIRAKLEKCHGEIRKPCDNVATFMG